MKNLLASALLGVIFAAHAMTVTATLVGSRQGTSVGGQAITVCIYQYNGQHFEKPFPMGTNCPISIQLQ